MVVVRVFVPVYVAVLVAVRVRVPVAEAVQRHISRLVAWNAPFCGNEDAHAHGNEDGDEDVESASLAISDRACLAREPR